MNKELYESVNFGANNLGSMCFNSLIEKKPNENVIISPLSISLLLHLLALGAEGETRRQALFQLGFEFEEELPKREALASVCNKLASTLQSADPKVAMSLANAVFHKPGIDLLPSYAKLAKTGFDAELKELLSAGQANDWVSQKTHEKITKILDQLDQSMIALLVNALYVKADWQNTFKKRLTKAAPFGFTRSDQVEVQMMEQVNHFKYMNDEGVQIIRLPLGSPRQERELGSANVEFCVYIILPHWRRCGNDTTQVIDWMVPANLIHLASRMETQHGKLLLPRVEAAFETSLKSILISAGMEDAFSASADFSKMFAEPTGARVSDVIHKTFVKLDETGFEGAAVTAAPITKTNVERQPPLEFTMEVNRPFAFYVCAEQQKQVPNAKYRRLEQTQLFAGRIVKPESK